MELKREVRGYGPTNAKIVIVGEAPGEDELRIGRPFVGQSGKLLREQVLAANLDEKEIRFENVIERKLERNSVEPLYINGRVGTLPGPELLAWYNDLHERIRSLSPTIIVPAGNTALHAIASFTGISNYHCTPCKGVENVSSSLECPAPIVLPIYHPASCFRAPTNKPWILYGLKKARRIRDGERDKTRKILNHANTLDTATVSRLLRTYASVQPVSIDIECFHNELTCIGFSWKSRETGSYDSVSVPLSIAGGSYWENEYEEEFIWNEIEKVLESPNTKIFQNFIFDTMILSRHGIFTNGTIEDTMLKAAVLHAELPKDLGSLAKLHTFAPAWKGSPKDWSAAVDPNALYVYNATDAAVTLEISESQDDELHARNLMSFYKTRVQRLMRPILSMCERGWNIDKEELSSIKSKMNDILMPLNDELAKKTKSYVNDFNPRSPKQVKELLVAMGMSVPTKDGKETSDRKSILKLMKRNPRNEILPLLLRHAKASKLKSTYADVTLDSDERLRFSVNIGGTKSGRFSSSQTAWKTGLNSQNIPSRDPSSPFNIRQIVIPDHKKTLVQVDLAQAEARIVAWLAREETMEHIFTNGGDIHTRTASLIFGADISKLPQEERKRRRYLGKKCVHAFNYGMGEETFIATCLDEADITVTHDEAHRLRTSYFRAFSRLTEWHREIQNLVRKTRKLRSPFGRERAFHGRLDDETFRDAYSFIPQASVADSLNEAWTRLEADTSRSELIQVLQQGHDSLLIQTPEPDLAIRKVQEAFDDVRFKIHGTSHSLPYDISIGPNWRDMKEIDV